MTATELATFSWSELKTICLDRAISVSGDRRLKASYILAIATFDSIHPELKTMSLAEPPELPTVKPSHPTPLEINLEFNAPSHQLPAPQHDRDRGASIGLIVPLIIILALFMTLKITIDLLAWSFAHLAPFLARQCRWNHQITNDSIDYFPFPL